MVTSDDIIERYRQLRDEVDTLSVQLCTKRTQMNCLAGTLDVFGIDPDAEPPLSPGKEAVLRHDKPTAKRIYMHKNPMKLILHLMTVGGKMPYFDVLKLQNIASEKNIKTALRNMVKDELVQVFTEDEKGMIILTTVARDEAPHLQAKLDAEKPTTPTPTLTTPPPAGSCDLTHLSPVEANQAILQLLKGLPDGTASRSDLMEWTKLSDTAMSARTSDLRIARFIKKSGPHRNSLWTITGPGRKRADAKLSTKKAVKKTKKAKKPVKKPKK